MSLALACLILPLSEGAQNGWPWWMFVLLGATLPLVWAFLRYEDRLSERGGMPLVDLELLAVRSFRRGCWVATLFFFTSPFYLLFAIERQDGAGLNPLHTGLSLLPYGIGMFLGPLASAPLRAALRTRLLSDRAGDRGDGLRGNRRDGGAAGGAWAVGGTVFIAGFGQGIAMPRLFNTVLQDVPPRQGGLAAGVMNSMLQIGAAISVAAIGTLFFAVLGGGPARPRMHMRSGSR